MPVITPTCRLPQQICHLPGSLKAFSVASWQYFPLICASREEVSAGSCASSSRGCSVAAEKTEPRIFRWKPCHHSGEKRELTDFLGFKLKLMFSDPQKAQFDIITLWDSTVFNLLKTCCFLTFALRSFSASPGWYHRCGGEQLITYSKSNISFYFRWKTPVCPTTKA